MKLRSISTALALSGLLLGTSGCKDFYDVNVDPIRPTKAELQQLLPVTQTATSTYLGFSIAGIGQATSALMGQLSNGRGIGTYQQNGDSFGNQWSGLYSEMLINNEQIIAQGTAEQRWSYVGIAQLQKAYVVSQMVDMFGDIPYSEALKGVTNLAPRYDKDQDIYNGNPGLGIQSLFSLIDEGIANLAKTGGAAPAREDLIYGGDLAKWTRFGRTLKLKLYVQIRKTRADGFRPEISALLANSSGLMGSEPGNDFEFKYGTSGTPANRNIGFLSDYVDVGRENSIGRYLYLLMRYRDGVIVVTPTTSVLDADPRIPYYFFNQLPSTLATNSTTTYDYQDLLRPAFITVRQGSTGPSANAVSSTFRTLPGLYPVGGRYDDGRGGNANTGFGRGTVAQRLLPYFSRKFLEAEAQLMVLNDRAAARAALTEAIDASFAKVNAIALAEGTSTPATAASPPNVAAAALGTSVLGIISTQDITAYRTKALARFDNSPRPLQIIMEEKYISSFGMGPDIYTDWRRTGFPVISVPDNANIGSNTGLVEDNDGFTRGAGLFPRRLFYSQSALTANPNPAAPKRQLTELDRDYRIFWDK